MKIAIIDFKSSFTSLIEECLTNLKIEYSVFENDVKKEELIDYSGIILTGSHDTVYDGGKKMNKDILEMNIPILGICYGHQLVHYLLGGEVKKMEHREEGSIPLYIRCGSLFKGLPNIQKVAMYHGDEVTQLASGFIACGYTSITKYAASECASKRIYTVQFHPEHKTFNDYGLEIFKNFIDICLEN